MELAVPGFVKTPDEVFTANSNTWFPTPSTAYRYSVVGGFRPTTEHTEFCTSLMPIGGNTVGVGATLTMSIPDCAIVVGELVVKNGEPATSVTLPPLPMANTETAPGTYSPVLSVVARSATNRNFPLGSITIT